MKTIKNFLGGLVVFAAVAMVFTACQKDDLITMGMGDTAYTGFDLSDDGTVVMNGDAQMDADEQMDEDGNTTAPCGCNRPMKQKCFTLVFPVQINQHDGTTTTINSEEDMKTMFEAQMQNNPRPPKGKKGKKGGEEGKAKCNNGPKPRKPKLVFPVDITLQDGTTATVTNKEDLKVVVDQCRANNDDQTTVADN